MQVGNGYYDKGSIGDLYYLYSFFFLFIIRFFCLSVDANVAFMGNGNIIETLIGFFFF